MAVASDTTLTSLARSSGSAARRKASFATSPTGRGTTDVTRSTAIRLKSELGWRPTVPFEDGLAETVAWYKANTTWIERVRSGAYRGGQEKS